MFLFLLIGLRDSLVQIMHDYHLQVSLQEGCKKILVSDCYSLIQRQVRIDYFMLIQELSLSFLSSKCLKKLFFLDNYPGVSMRRIFFITIRR